MTYLGYIKTHQEYRPVNVSPDLRTTPLLNEPLVPSPITPFSKGMPILNLVFIMAHFYLYLYYKCL